MKSDKNRDGKKRERKKKEEQERKRQNEREILKLETKRNEKRKVWIFLKILRLTAKHIENLRITKLSIYYLSVYVALFRMTDNSEETE